MINRQRTLTAPSSDPVAKLDLTIQSINSGTVLLLLTTFPSATTFSTVTAWLLPSNVTVLDYYKLSRTVKKNSPIPMLNSRYIPIEAVKQPYISNEEKCRVCRITD